MGQPTLPTPGVMERTAGWLARRARQRVNHSDANPFLQGPFAPVQHEMTETDLLVSGTIPYDMNGVFARIGPNPIQVANSANYHWFLGDGMVHGVRFRNGKALWYRNRWIGSDSANKRLGRSSVPGPQPRDIDVVNTNILGHAGQIWALVEGGEVPVTLDAELETVRRGFFNTPHRRAFTAHPHRDPITSDLHAICYDVMMHDRVFYVVIGADGALRRDVPIPVRHGPMMHDCALTASRMVILDLPVTFSMGAVMRGNTFPYRWNTKHPARVGLLPRDGQAADIVWFDVEPCFAFHTANAYDRADGSVVLDLITYPRVFDDSMQGPDGNRSILERWVLTPGAGRVRREPRSDHLQEFPRFDERRTGQDYRYAYTIGFDTGKPGAQPLYRHDMTTGAHLRHDFGPHHLPGEAVFVPRHAEAAEDDGWLLTFVYDLAAHTSTLTVIDAGNIGGEPAAVIHLPARVPLGFHGNWISDLD